MQMAGLEGQQVVLLLEDYQFVHPAFLEMVNSLLSSGLYYIVSLILPCDSKYVFFFFSENASCGI